MLNVKVGRYSILVAYFQPLHATDIFKHARKGCYYDFYIEIDRREIKGTLKNILAGC